MSSPLNPHAPTFVPSNASNVSNVSNATTTTSTTTTLNSIGEKPTPEPMPKYKYKSIREALEEVDMESFYREMDYHIGKNKD